MKTSFRLLALLILVAMVLAACPAPAQPTEAPAARAAAEATTAPADDAAAPADATEAPAAAEGTTPLNIWSFTNEINTMAVAYEGKHPEVDATYSMIPMTNGEYQTKLKAALGTSDAPDVIALEASFVKQYVESDILADLAELLPAERSNHPFVSR